jgi:hypothetical protein
MSSISENWNGCADHTSNISCQLTWTDPIGQTMWRLTGERAQTLATGEGRQRAEHDLATDDHEVQATLASSNWSSGTLKLGVAARYKTINASSELYRWAAELSNSPQRWVLYKLAGGTWTLLGSAEQAIVVGDVMKLRCDGSTITGFVNGVALVTVTDTAVVGHTRCGLWGESGTADVATIDDWSAADLPEPQNLMGAVLA